MAIVTVYSGIPACVMVTFVPAMETVVVRVVFAVLAAIDSWTVPLPVLFAPAATVTQVALLVAAQPQPAPVVTLTLMVVAVSATLIDVVESVFAQAKFAITVRGADIIIDIVVALPT